MLIQDRLTSLLYLSKVSTFQRCPKSYYWQHHLHIHPKDKPSYFAFGSAFHKAVIDCGLATGLWPAGEAYLSQEFEALTTFGVNLNQKDKDLILGIPENDRNLMHTMLDQFAMVWDAVPRTVYTTEKSVKFELSKFCKLFTDWVVKADFIFEENGEVWVGDLKTTSGYGASTAKYYHSSPQTKTYFWILQQLMPNLRGTKIFVVTKQKVRCEVETIILTEADKYQAQLFVEEATKAIQDAEDRGVFPRCMTSCVNTYGQECPYIPLCTQPIRSEGYIEDLLSNWYTFSSPDEHLELED